MSETNSIDVNYVARLARINLTEEEKEMYGKQLKSIVGYIEKLNEVDIDNVEPIAHAFPLSNVWQEDEPTETFTQEEALLNAPAKRSQQVVVPKVVD